jgi:hypothetical protein
MPGHLIVNRIETVIRETIQNNPALDWSLPLTRWTDAHETALTTRLLAAAIAVNDTQDNTASWPNYPDRNTRQYVLNNQLGSMATRRNSFVFDRTGI